MSSSQSKIECNDDIDDLVYLVHELNQHSELTVKVSSTKKITKLLEEIGTDEVDDKASAQGPIHVSSVNFRQRMAQEMKGLKVDPSVRQILDTCLQNLVKLQADKDEEIEEFMEEHAEAKFRATQDIKKRFTVKIALATKANDTE